MNNIVIYSPELNYQKNREKLFFLFKEIDKENKYYYFNIEELELKEELNQVGFFDDLIKKVNPEISGNINHIFFYPRQVKTIDNTKKIYQLLIETNINKSIFIDDIHCLTIDLNILEKFNYKFMTYGYLTDMFLKDIKLTNIIKLPHYLNNEFIYKKATKNINISIIGHNRSDGYLTRRKINLKLNDINNKLINCKLEGYSKVKNAIYYNILNRSYVSIATSLDNPSAYYPYIVSKYFEIPGCNCLLLAHVLPEMKEELKSYGFIENENYLEFKDIDDLINKCNFIFDPKNKDIIEKIRQNGFDLIKNNHLITNRVKTILNIINKKN